MIWVLSFKTVFLVRCNLDRAQDNRGIEDNSKIIFLFLNENLCCDPSLEPSR